MRTTALNTGFGLLIIFFLITSCLGTGLQVESSLTSPYDLVIITSEEYSDILQSFIDHKESMNILILLKTTEDIYETYLGRDNPEKIKYFIKEMKENHSTEFVLFIGNNTAVPTRYTNIYYEDDFGYPTPSHWVFPSDFYYADLYDINGVFSSWDSNGNDIFAEYNWDGNYDTFDLTPDISIGRLPCNNDQEVGICIQKIIAYETNKAWSETWFNDIICIGGDSLPYDKENIDEGEYVQQHVIDILEGFIPTRIWASLGTLNTPQIINDAINNGAGFVFFNGHGLSDLWATHPHNSNLWIPSGSYTIKHIDLLENQERLPIIISDACYHCQYDRHDDCFAWSFVRNPNGGAIAFIGGSDTDLGYPGTAIITKGIERLCLEISHQYMDGCQFLGRLITSAISVYTNDSINEVDIITVLQNHLFGDPSLKISGISQPPLTPKPPNGEISGKIQVEYSYSMNTEDPDGDDIFYLLDWGDDTESEWIGPYESGDICITTHVWEKQGSYQLRVRAKDEHGIQSNWSDPLLVSMPQLRSIRIIDQLISQYHYTIRALGWIRDMNYLGTV